MASRVRRAIAVPEAYISKQPLAPQGHAGPWMLSVRCPSSAALPLAPRIKRPSTITPPPIPVDTVI